MQLRSRFHATVALCAFLLSALCDAGNTQGALHNHHLAEAMARNVVDGNINFAGFKDDPALNAFLKAIARFDLDLLKSAPRPDATAAERKEAVEFERKSRIAFWVNAYNALMLKAIVDRYDGRLNSVKQIRDLAKKPIAEVAGKPRSLREIEESILRREFREPRVAFLLYRGMLGGPRLPLVPVSAHHLEEDIQSAVQDLFKRKGTYRVDSIGGIVWLPDFVESYERDFGGATRLLTMLAPFFPLRREQEIARQEDVTVKYWQSDSRLEDRPQKQAGS